MLINTHTFKSREDEPLNQGNRPKTPINTHTFTPHEPETWTQH